MENAEKLFSFLFDFAFSEMIKVSRFGQLFNFVLYKKNTKSFSLNEISSIFAYYNVLFEIPQEK